MPGRLKLVRPIAFFDIESTGVVPQRDRIVEIAVVKLWPDGHQQTTVRRLNPGIPIPAGATAIHGITDADVADAPAFADIAEKLFNYLSDCDLAGYNITGFDVPILEAEFKRAGYDFAAVDHKIVDAYNIFCKLYPRTLTAAYKFFCGKDLDDAHSAGSSVATFSSCAATSASFGLRPAPGRAPPCPGGRRMTPSSIIAPVAVFDSMSAVAAAIILSVSSVTIAGSPWFVRNFPTVSWKNLM